MQKKTPELIKKTNPSTSHSSKHIFDSLKTTKILVLNFFIFFYLNRRYLKIITYFYTMNNLAGKKYLNDAIFESNQ